MTFREDAGDLRPLQMVPLPRTDRPDQDAGRCSQPPTGLGSKQNGGNTDIGQGANTARDHEREPAT